MWLEFCKATVLLQKKCFFLLNDLKNQKKTRQALRRTTKLTPKSYSFSLNCFWWDTLECYGLFCARKFNLELIYLSKYIRFFSSLNWKPYWLSASLRPPQSNFNKKLFQFIMLKKTFLEGYRTISKAIFYVIHRLYVKTLYKWLEIVVM